MQLFTQHLPQLTLQKKKKRQKPRRVVSHHSNFPGVFRREVLRRQLHQRSHVNTPAATPSAASAAFLLHPSICPAVCLIAYEGKLPQVRPLLELSMKGTGVF